MSPGQYIGGPNERQDRAPGEPRPSGKANRMSAVPLALLWVGLGAALVAGVVLYFLYERGIVPLFGGRG
jgi:hypothetical protein